MKNMLCGLVAAVALCLGAASQANAQIAVTGNAKVTVKPDFAVINFNVTTAGDTATVPVSVGEVEVVVNVAVTYAVK